MEHDFIVITSKGKIGQHSRLLQQNLISNLIKSAAGRQALAQSMANPIRTRLDYQGLARRCLAIDPLPQGASPTYDKDIDIVSSIVGHNPEEEEEEQGTKEVYCHDAIIITSRKRIGQRRVFGQRVTVPTFEVVSNPTVRLSDVKRRRFNIIDRAVQKARTEIMSQEDDDIFAALDASVNNDIR